MTKLAICSDLHLEFGDINLSNTNNADVLILSGDIMIAQTLHDRPASTDEADNLMPASGKQKTAQRYRNFIKRCSEQFPNVIAIAGNHEFYNGRWVAALDYLRTEYSKYPNVHFLENETVTINDVVFVGATTWTNCNNGDPLTMYGLRDCMTDFRLIRNDSAAYRVLSTRDIVIRHQQTMKYFESTLGANADKKCVIVGHHTPSFQSCHSMYSGANDRIMNGGYHSELTEFILGHPQIALWTCGHTHHRHRYYVGDTLVVCNPRGYINHEPLAARFTLKDVDLNNMPTKTEIQVDYDWDDIIN